MFVSAYNQYIRLLGKENLFYTRKNMQWKFTII